MRPLLEYSSLVWDNCAIYEKECLEKMQYEAARVVTGLTRSVSINRLLIEVGWIPLSKRREMQKLILIYRQNHNSLPQYICEQMPPTIEQTTNYPLRNRHNYVTIPRRLSIYSKSTIPSSIDLWNRLDVNVRNSNTLNEFKSRLKNTYTGSIVPKYYLAGDRLSNIHHTRIRNACSNLNAHLHINFLRDNPICDCGQGTEDPEHYFFKCSSYGEERVILFRNTRIFHPLSTSKLLFGIENNSVDDNSRLFTEVQKYIKLTKRFF